MSALLVWTGISTTSLLLPPVWNGIGTGIGIGIGIGTTQWNGIGTNSVLVPPVVGMEWYRYHQYGMEFAPPVV